MGDERPLEEPPVDATRMEKLTRFAAVVAVALIAVYLVVLLLAFFDVGVDAESWARRISLLGGLEALAFAGAGAILGTTVQRQTTKKAEEQAAEAKQTAERERVRAQANQKDAEKGRALDALARTKAARVAAQPTSGTRDLGDAETVPPSDFDEMVALSDWYEGRSTP